MNKRGSSHIDWAIGMGIFLTYVLSMFIFLQPGVMPFHSEKIITKIAQDAVLAAGFFEQQERPVFVTPLEDGLKNNKVLCIPLGNDDTVLTEDYTVKRVSIDGLGEEELLPVKSLVYNIQKGEVMGDGEWNSNDISPFPTHCWGTPNVDKCNPVDESNNWDCYTSMDKYQLVFNAEREGSNAELAIDRYTYRVYHAKGKYPNIDNIHKVKKIGQQVMYEYKADTVPTVIEAFSEESVNEQLSCDTQEEYEDLKEKWKFPPAKDFALYYVPTDTTAYSIGDIIPLCNVAGILADKVTTREVIVPPVSGADITVKEWSDILLNTETNEQTNIIMNLKVW